MKIAIASCGLGHIARGVETWALDTANALYERGADVTLLGGGALPAGACRTRFVALSPLRRFDAQTLRRAAETPRWAWRWGLKSGYGWEQLTFWRQLWPVLRRERFDILHVQDPMVAYWCRRFRRLGLVRTREILAHGTEESAAFIRKFEYVQHLAPWHFSAVGGRRAGGEGCSLFVAGCQDKREAMGGRGSETPTTNNDQLTTPPVGDRMSETPTTNNDQLTTPLVGDGSETPTTNNDQLTTPLATPLIAGRPYWVVLPNFVDTELFRPATGRTGREAVRRQFGLPADALVLGCVSAVKRAHKRIDYVIREFAELLREAPRGRQWHLVIAGASQAESAELEALAHAQAPGRIHFYCDLPRERMPDLYRCLDLFVMGSLFEMMPIALLEALATGLPALVNAHPVMTWMIGDGGLALRLEDDGALTAALLALTPDWLEAKATKARAEACARFGKFAVISSYLDYYTRVANA